ncbi:MAG: TIGR02556 family CRISPR-associated protein [bacterium]|nr:TIGR02556 family CRISPR-associated protein [bacterium]
MLSAIKELGAWSLGRGGRGDVLSVLIQPVDAGFYPYTMVIQLDDTPEYAFQGIYIEDTNAPGEEKYIYRRGSPNGSNFSPTAMLIESGKTFDGKIIQWFKRVAKELDLPKSDKALFEAVRKELELKKKTIITAIEDEQTRLKKGAVLTLRIGERYLYDIPAFVSAFLGLVQAKSDRISATGKVCSVCGERKDYVTDGACFSFYTNDKPGFIAGHFDAGRSWRNHPVCADCALQLEEGKRLLADRLSFYFYGLSYQVVPQFTIGELHDDILPVLLMADRKTKLAKDSSGARLTSDENEILDYLAQQQDSMALHLFFLRKVQGAERILLLIDDVLPSRLQTIFAAKAGVDAVFPEHPFSFGRIRMFFRRSSEGKREDDLDKYFLEITNSIFKGLSLSVRFLMPHFMREIRREFNNSAEDGKWAYMTLDAVQTLLFMDRLHMFRKEMVAMSETIFDPVFNRYCGQLDRPEKRAVFLLGALTRMLLNVQYVKRKSQPFMTELGGLKLDERRVKGLLPKVINKLQEYESYDKGKAEMAAAASELFLQASPSWRMSVDELNFYLACGMSLYREINGIVYTDAENKEESKNVNQ